MHFLPDVYVPCEACRGAREKGVPVLVMDSWSRGGKPREGLATSKPPSFHFTVGISITGFLACSLRTNNCTKQLRATAHQLIEHRIQGNDARQNERSFPHQPASNQKTYTNNCTKQLRATAHQSGMRKADRFCWFSSHNIR